MAALTFFIATSPTPKQFSLEELETFIQGLLQERHVLLPAVIYVGRTRNDVRDENIEAVNEYYTTHSPTEYIVPNAPETMHNLTEDIAEGKWGLVETLWYFGENEVDFMSALRRVSFGDSNCCICFPYLDRHLLDNGWRGAAIYRLSKPFPIDFMDIFDTTAHPLIDYPTANYFTLHSVVGGKFSHVAHNPLEPLLIRYFGSDLDMKQTL